MKVISFTLIFCVVALFCQAQQSVPKPFLEIIKENKIQQKKIPFAIRVSDAPVPSSAIIILPIDHMPCLVPENSWTAVMPVLQTPLLQNVTTIPNAFKIVPTIPQ
jgi:hypothetical protein